MSTKIDKKHKKTTSKKYDSSCKNKNEKIKTRVKTKIITIITMK